MKWNLNTKLALVAGILTLLYFVYQDYSDKKQYEQALIREQYQMSHPKPFTWTNKPPDDYKGR